MIVCAAPNPSIDKLFVTDAVTVGAIHRPDRVVARAGGKGLNVARAAHALGGDVVAVALLAGHAGRWIAQELAAAGVRAEAVEADGETRSALSVAADGRLTEFYERGTPPGADAWARFRARVGAVAEATGAGWVSISGSLPPGVPAGEGAALVRVARASGARVAVDLAAAVLDAALGAGPDLVKVNRAEAAALAGHDDPARAAALLRDRALAGGAAPETAAAVVTLGGDGAVALTPDGTLLTGDLDVRAPYPTGSGDAFLGGLLVALDRGARWPDALAGALGCACANAEAEGAGSVDPGRAGALAARARARVVAAA